MTNSKANNVRITPGTSQKYVLVAVSGLDGEVILLWGNPNAEWHKNIVEEISAHGHSIIRVEGGGRIRLHPDERTIHVWDVSTRYGEAPADVVRTILETSFPDYRCFIGQRPDE